MEIINPIDRLSSEIIANNTERERNTLSEYACLSESGLRRFPQREKVLDRENIRTVFFHDTDKIIHSLAYTRYIDKTQVFSLFENDHITHRVLHVQFVSKIGRVIGRCLRLNEDLIEAIALGHDIGHVPYGHEGERTLHTLCQENGIGCFYHNAQSVRALRELENDGKGLNLSLQVLDGILAHNGEMVSEKYEPRWGKTWEQFDKEYRKSFKVEKYSKNIVPMTLEGCVVRIADVIAYIGRDIEDAIRVGLIDRSDMPTTVSANLGNSNDTIINALAMDLIRNSYGKEYLLFSGPIFKSLQELKTFNQDNIYGSPRIKTEGDKMENMFRQLFARYCRALETGDTSSAVYGFVKDMPKSYAERTNPKRIVVDFIAGMTDDFFNDQFQKLFVPQSYGYRLVPPEADGR